MENDRFILTGTYMKMEVDIFQFTWPFQGRIPCLLVGRSMLYLPSLCSINSVTIIFQREERNDAFNLSSLSGDFPNFFLLKHSKRHQMDTLLATNACLEQRYCSPKDKQSVNVCPW